MRITGLFFFFFWPAMEKKYLNVFIYMTLVRLSLARIILFIHVSEKDIFCHTKVSEKLKLKFLLI